MIDPYRLLSPLLRRFDPEQAHRMAIWALKSGAGFAFGSGPPDDPRLATQLWGMRFSNPVGIAAGFDKNAEVVDPLLRLGCGSLEIGAVTPRPQPGNPRPRLFRLEEDRAVINRLGFNSEGLAAVVRRLAQRKRGQGLVGVNLGKNKESQDAASDYAAVAEGVAPYADFLTINVSSPNTPGLRTLQNIAPLEAIIRATRAARDRAVGNTGGAAPVLLLKISPDLDSSDLKDIVALALAEKLDGLSIANTTIGRPASLVSGDQAEAGGLSGAPLFELSTNVLRRAFELSEGKLPLVGVGGISSGADAYAKIRAGASLVQLYSALVYEGPGLIGRIKHDLAVFLKRDGFATVAAAVGADHGARRS